MNKKGRFGVVIPLFLSLCMVAAVGNATDAVDEGNPDKEQQSQRYRDPRDPLEGLNRAFHSVNDDIDKGILVPIAEAYQENIPAGGRARITNVLDNLGYIGVIINDLLQGKFKDTAKDTGRFLVNTTVGVLGIFDPATSMGLERHNEDFGQTLGVWGSSEVAYLELPFLGPSSFRDVPGLVVDMFTNIVYYMGSGFAIPLIALDVIDTRANLLPATRVRDAAALNRDHHYAITRSAYRQRRDALVRDEDVSSLDVENGLNGNGLDNGFEEGDSENGSHEKE